MRAPLNGARVREQAPSLKPNSPRIETAGTVGVFERIELCHGAIHRAGGPELLAECRGLGGCPTGEARITRGYRLPARFVIHTVGPIYSGSPRDAELLGNCYHSSLQLAAERDLDSVAFPAVSCGVYGYPVKEACAVALAITRDFLEASPTPRRVIFALFSPEHYEVHRHVP